MLFRSRTEGWSSQTQTQCYSVLSLLRCGPEPSSVCSDYEPPPSNFSACWRFPTDCRGQIKHSTCRGINTSVGSFWNHRRVSVWVSPQFLLKSIVKGLKALHNLHVLIIQSLREEHPEWYIYDLLLYQQTNPNSNLLVIKKTRIEPLRTLPCAVNSK